MCEKNPSSAQYAREVCVSLVVEIKARAAEGGAGSVYVKARLGQHQSKSKERRLTS